MPIVVAAVIAAGGAVYAANKQSSAARSAANQQNAATQQALGFQQQALGRTEGELRPYVNEGNAARGYYNALLGIPGQTAQNGGQQREDWAGYWARMQPTTTNNPTSPWHQIAAQTDGSAEALGKAFYQYRGGQDGPVDMITDYAAATPEQTAATRTEAYGAFEQSPYSAAANYGEQKGMQAIMGAAGAGGGVLRGRTANALADNARGYKANALLQYMSQLSGVADRGYSASTGIASGGQTFANNASGIVQNGAANSGNALMQGANAQAQGVSDAIGALSWSLGTMYGGGGMNAMMGNKSALPGSYYAPSTTTSFTGPR